MRALSALLALTFLWHCQTLAKAEDTLFYGEVNEDGINVRTDATVASQAICLLQKGARLEVTSEAYDWYKIRLPKEAPLFINKKMVSVAEDGASLKVEKDNVNLRLAPNESAAILGRAKQGQVLAIAGEEGDWYKVEPPANSFGWIHKKFVNKATLPQPFKKAEATAPSSALAAPTAGQEVTVEGIVRPKTIKTIATHKLISGQGTDKKIYLLKGDKQKLNALNSRNAKITGTLQTSPEENSPAVITVTSMETLD